MIVEGDSIPAGFGLAPGLGFPVLFADQNGETIGYDDAVAGVKWATINLFIAGAMATQIPGARGLGTGRIMVMVSAGGNDIFDGETAVGLTTIAEDWLAAVGAAVIANPGPQPVKTVAFTIIPAASMDGAMNAQRLAWNAILLANAMGFDFVVDAASIPELQDTSDPIWFQPDGVHPTAAGQQLIADLMATTVLV